MLLVSTLVGVVLQGQPRHVSLTSADAVVLAASAAPTMSTLLAAALVSVVISTVVTLVVEWFAKPKLEARKERILERQRVLRKVAAVAKAERRRLDDEELARIDRTSPFRGPDDEPTPAIEEDSAYGEFRRLRSELGEDLTHEQIIALERLHAMLAADPGVVDVTAKGQVLDAAADVMLASQQRWYRRSKAYQTLKDVLGKHGM